MGKYSKSKIKRIRGIKAIVIFFALIIVLCIYFIIYINIKNTIVVENVDYSASGVSDEIASNSYPIIVDNAVLGAVYDKTFVSSERYYLKSKNNSDIDINIYNSKGKAGDFKLTSISKAKSGTAIYAFTTNTNTLDSYFAVEKSDTNIMKNPVSKDIDVTQEDIDYVKDALGAYRLLNSTIKITEAYDISIKSGEMSRLIFVTNESKNNNGVYSAVIYVDNAGKAKCIKYSYVKDVLNASSWPIYSLKYVADLNNDLVNEIIIQETKEFEVKYDILEYRKNKFYEVLSTTMKI